LQLFLPARNSCNRLSSLNVASYSYDSSNHLTSSSNGVTYTYDNNGNTATKGDASGTTTYTWSNLDQLTSVALPGTGGTVTFKYDPFGRRIQKVSPTIGTNNYLYDGANIVEEVGASGNQLARYTQGQGIDQPLAMLRSGASSLFQADGLGSITGLGDSVGNSGATYKYDSFGKLRVSTGTPVNPFQYTGRDYDPETGLRYYRARYYDLNVGRFISEDPIRFDGGINFNIYALNNPTNLIDPSGLRPGDKYGNLRCAGWHAIWDINQTSKKHNREFGGWMYQNPDGTFSYTAPVEGGPAGVDPQNFNPIPPDTNIAGDYHTHGAYDPNLNMPGNPRPGAPGYNWNNDGNEVFSDPDKAGNELEGGTGYLGTPQGTTEEYRPNGHPLNGPVTVLTQRNCGCH
jgi:RHS repeat-associated protein